MPKLRRQNNVADRTANLNGRRNEGFCNIVVNGKMWYCGNDVVSIVTDAC